MSEVNSLLKGQLSSKFNLVKPLKSEKYNVDVFNGNADIIDAQIYSKTEVDNALNGKAPLVHTHPISEVTNLQTALDGKVDKLMATNLVTNGDFSNGTTGWSSGGIPLLVENNSLRLHLDNTSGATVHPNVRQTIQGVSGNIYYVAFDVINNVSGASASTFFQFGSQVALNYTGNGRRSVVFTADNNATTIFFNNTVPNNVLLSLNIDNVLLLNLTATFGAGNEPTKWQMDHLVVS